MFLNIFSNYALLFHYFLGLISIFSLCNINLNAWNFELFENYNYFFILIVIIIFPICYYVILIGYTKTKSLIFLLFSLELLLLLCFLTQNLLIFYITFEAILIPMYLLVGMEGFGFRKIKSAYLLFMYTLIGSFFMFFAIFYLNFLIENFSFLQLTITNFSLYQQKILCFCFFIAFAVKVPCIPFHLWLPEAHVESTTVGSILLASLILKLPGYGLISFVIPWFPLGCLVFERSFQTLSCISILYAALSSFRQLDLKKIIAYSSVSHMNFIVLGIFSNNIFGLYGSVYLMIGHAIVSSALFFCVGILYFRTHSKNLYYLAGLSQLMPLLSGFFFFFSLSNMSFPGTVNFIGEIFIFLSIIFTNIIVALFSCLTIIFSAIYAIWIYNRVCFGTIKKPYFIQFKDLTFNEFNILLIFLWLTLVFGVFSNSVCRPGISC